MPGQAQLAKLCSFTQVIPGYDITVPDAPVPVFFNVLIDATGMPIPPDSTQYSSTGTNFTGDGSGFIRSFYTDMTMQVVTGVDWVPAATYGTGSVVASSSIMRTESLLSGKLIVRYHQGSESAVPEASVASGLLSITWGESHTPVSARFFGVPGDLNGNELIIQNSGGKDSSKHSQTTDSGYWPIVYPRPRTNVDPNAPREQETPGLQNDYDVLDLPITTPGVTRTQINGLQGDFEIPIQY